MSKYTENLQKEAEKLAKITHEKNREYQPSIDPWDKLSEREQYIKTEMQYDAARYVLEARAAEWQNGYKQSYADYKNNMTDEYSIDGMLEHIGLKPIN